MRRLSIGLVLAACLWVPSQAQATVPRPAPHLPLYFEPGVAGDFIVRAEGYSAGLDPHGLSLNGKAGAFRLAFPGSRAVRPQPLDLLPGRVSYLVGPQASWRRGVPTFAGVHYPEMYPGVDVRFHAAAERLEYDFLIAPGASTRGLGIQVAGATPVIDREGGIVWTRDGRELQQKTPVAFQTVGGVRHAVDVRYRLDRDGAVRFVIGHYDHRAPLVIDPVLVYASYVFTYRMAADPAGNTYFVGFGPSGYPVTPGAYDTTFNGAPFDVLVSKLNAAGTQLVYATYLGGSKQDRGWAIAVDSTGAAYVTGDTASTDFPTTASAYDRTCGVVASTCDGSIDAFVAKLDPSGSTLVYSTFLGGSNLEIPNGIAVGPVGEVWLTGMTFSRDLPFTAGAYQTVAAPGFASDGFIFGLDPTGSALTYGSYFSGIGEEAGFAVTVDGSGNAIFALQTESPGLPTVAANQQFAGASDAFVLKLNPAHAVVYATYLGGPDSELNRAIAVDNLGAVYVGGSTGLAFPVTKPHLGTLGNASAYLTKLSSTGAVQTSMTFGGIGDDGVNAIALDPSGRIHLTGLTGSSDLPLTPDAVQTSVGSSYYLALDPTGTTPLYWTYIGGPGDGTGMSIAYRNNQTLLAGLSSAGFPTVNAYQSTAAPLFSGFLMRFDWNPPVSPVDPLELVLYTAHAVNITGNWQLESDPSAAAGKRIRNPDAGAPKVATPVANPASYFELTFTAEAGVLYTLWIRGQAEADNYNNDSAYVQFSDTIDPAGHPIWRIGSTSAATYIVEACSGCLVKGWGWNDNAYGTGVAGQAVQFASSGEKRLRIQPREDGISIDQVVLSSERYIAAAPGAPKQDSTVLIPELTGSGPPSTCTPGELVLHTADAAVVGTAWEKLNDVAAASGVRAHNPNLNAAKVPTPLANPASYIDLTFNALAGVPYRVWIRGEADQNSYNNDSVYLQFSDSVDSSGHPLWQIGTTSASPFIIEDCTNCGVHGWGWNDLLYGVGLVGPTVQFAASGQKHLRIQPREDGISIDQVILSASTWMAAMPGLAKDDATIYPKCTGRP